MLVKFHRFASWPRVRTKTILLLQCSINDDAIASSQMLGGKRASVEILKVNILRNAAAAAAAISSSRFSTR